MSIAKEIKTTSASSVRWKWIILVALPVAAFLLSFPLGRYPVSLEQLITVLAAKVFPIAHTWPSTIDTVIFKVRLPRIIAAMLVGAALATSGAAYQGMFKNPLVSPDILGASAGAGFGAALAIFFSYSYFGIQIFSFLFGLAALKTQNILVLTLSIVTGGILGEALRIEERLDSFGRKLEGRFGGGGLFIKGFVTGSLVFCVGAMAIMGALESGLTGRHMTLFIKSILDGVTATVFASTMGIGVAFSALPVFLYQGAITVAAVYVKPFLTDAMIIEMSAAGGLLIFGIGLNMLTDKLHIKVGNLLPAIFVAIFFVVLFGKFSF
jgi:uncharacterized membrane protein YqgA involved in biofilm formation